VRAPLRTVIESQHVTHVVYMESQIYRRMDEAFKALKWWLARVPDSGQIIDDFYWLYKQRGNRELNIPSLTVIYTFDHNTVEMFSLLVRLPALDHGPAAV